MKLVATIGWPQLEETEKDVVYLLHENKWGILKENIVLHDGSGNIRSPGY